MVLGYCECLNIFCAHTVRGASEDMKESGGAGPFLHVAHRLSVYIPQTFIGCLLNPEPGSRRQGFST